MSTITELHPRLLALTEAGVSVWLDQEVPGAGYWFGTLIAAQAAGHLEALRSHGLPAERVDVEGDPAPAMRALTERITAILQES